MQLMNTFNKGIRFLLCFIDIFSKYAWVAPLKDKLGITIVNAFQRQLQTLMQILDTSKRKQSKIWVDQDSEFYNSSFKKWSDNNDIDMYSTHREVKSVVAERFIRTLINKIYKHMTPLYWCVRWYYW